jgi:hypothetical protein
MASALWLAVAACAAALLQQAQAQAQPTCSPGAVLFEERFDTQQWALPSYASETDPNTNRHLPPTTPQLTVCPACSAGARLPSFANLSAMTAKGWQHTFTSSAADGHQEYAGWNLWHRDVAATWVQPPRDSHEGVLQAFSGQWFQSAKTTPTSPFLFSATLTSPTIPLPTACPQDVLISFAVAHQACTSCNMAVAWHDAAGTVLSTVPVYDASAATANKLVVQPLTPPGSAAKLQLILTATQSNTLSYAYFTLDNLVVRSGKLADDPTICSDASATQAVWRGGDGLWQDASQWCNQRVGTSDTDVLLRCPHAREVRCPCHKSAGFCRVR